MNDTKELALVETSGLPIGSIDAYIARVNQIPLLTAEEEFELGRRLLEQGDVSAAKKLVLSHLRYVVHVARGFLGYGLSLADLIQEGNIGLMKAVKRFNPQLKIRLVTFAVHWIKAEMHEFVIRNWRIVKIATTKAQRKLFFNLRSAKQTLSWCTPAEIELIAKDLKVKPSEVREMESRLYSQDTSFDGHTEDEDTPSFAPVHYLEDNRLSPATLLESHLEGDARTAVVEALESLNERDRDILYSRWLADKKLTLHDLAAKYDISAERVRQLEKAAIDKLKKALIK